MEYSRLLLLKDFSDYAQGEFLELLSWILLTTGFIIVLCTLIKRFVGPVL